MKLRLGQRLGELKIGLPLGKGKYSVVYEATSLINKNKKVAIKMTDNEELFNSLWEEKEILKTLSHKGNKNIIKIYGFHYFARNQPGGFIVMELMESDLTKQIEKLNFHDKFMVIKQILRGLKQHHDYEIIHRDIKPQNILLNIKQSGIEAKVADFGLAKFISQNPAYYEAGTYHYVAPEIKEGKKIDHKCDIYSLAVIMEELFRIYKAEPLLQFIQKGKAHNPDDRYYDCQEMSSELEQLIEKPEIVELIGLKQKIIKPDRETIKLFFDAKNSFFKRRKLEKLIESPYELIHPCANFELGKIYVESIRHKNFEKALNHFEEAYYSIGISKKFKSKLSILIAYCYSNLGKKIEAKVFCDNYGDLSGEQINPDSDLEKLAKKTLWSATVDNEIYLNELWIHK